jgi:hypothetical protein
MSTTVKMTRSAKRILEEIQAQLRLDTEENIDQYKLLEKILIYIKEHYAEFRGHVFLTRQLNKIEIENYKSLIVDYEVIDKREEDKLIYGD